MNEIYHHGVKGQKWGVRRYQNKDGSLTPAGKSRYSSNSKSKYKNAEDLVKAKSNTRVSELAGGTEENVVIATYIATIGFIAAAAKISEKISRKKKERELDELKDNREIKSFDELPKLSKKMSLTDSVKVTNPDYPDLGSTMNCTFCTTAMALREKGYDVKAAKSAEGWYSDSLFDKTFNSPEIKLKGSRTVKNVIDELSSNGDGAYGNISVTWKYGGAHSIFWKNENGTTNFYDGQSGQSYTKFSDKKSIFDYVNISRSTYQRLDNCEPTEYALGLVERNEK